MTSLLVLGGGGPIGAALARTSAASGVPAHVATRRDVDVADRVALRTAIESIRPAAIINLVGSRQADHARAATPADHEAELARNVVDAAARGGVARVVYASSAAVYGDRGSTPFVESSRLGGTSEYAGMKIAAEVEMRARSHDQGVNTLIARIFNVYGPGCENSLINKLLGPEKPQLLLAGRFIRDYVYVDEVAEALIAACRCDVAGTVNVASGRGVDNRELATVVGSDAYVDAGSTVDSFSVGSADLAESVIGWRARRSVLEYLRSSR